MEILWILLIPVIAIIGSKFIAPREITVREMAAMFIAVLLVSAVPFALITHSNRHDTEIRNGAVVKKYQQSVPCTHCRTVCTGSGKSRSCRTVCDHFNDYDWVVQSTAGNFTIARVDRRGSTEPPRFTAVQINEPVSLEHSYQNYVKAAAATLFRDVVPNPEEAVKVPPYPRVFDYHRINRVITVGRVSGIDTKTFNDILNDGLKTLGPQRQLNIVVIITDQSASFAQTLEASWLGAKKNDLVIVYGMDGQSINFVYPFTFANSSGNELLTVELRDTLVALQNLKDVDAHATAILEFGKSKYKRKSMEDFAYLAAESRPSGLAIAIITVVTFLVLIVGIFVSLNNNERTY